METAAMTLGVFLVLVEQREIGEPQGHQNDEHDADRAHSLVIFAEVDERRSYGPDDDAEP